LTRFALLAAGCVTLTGCGTFSDAICGPANDQAYYRGVSFDLLAAHEGKVFMLVDIPFSFVADSMRAVVIAYDRFQKSNDTDTRTPDRSDVIPAPRTGDIPLLPQPPGRQ
jgi:uncharacterized protein YceK